MCIKLNKPRIVDKNMSDVRLCNVVTGQPHAVPEQPVGSYLLLPIGTNSENRVGGKEKESFIYSMRSIWKKSNHC